MAYNEVVTTAIGHIATDITVRTTTQGRNVATFRLVTQERRYDRETGLWSDGERVFFSVSCWGWMATNVQRSLAKGDLVVVTGRIKIREYVTDSGDKRESLDLTARAIGPDLSVCSAVVTRQSKDHAVEEPLPLPMSTAA